MKKVTASEASVLIFLARHPDDEDAIKVAQCFNGPAREVAEKILSNARKKGGRAMPKTLEDLRKEYSDLRAEYDREVAAVNKKFAGRERRLRKKIADACNHAYVLELRRHINNPVLGSCDRGCLLPYAHSKSLIRTCCLCGTSEPSRGVMADEKREGKYLVLTQRPFQFLYDELSFSRAAEKYLCLPISGSGGLYSVVMRLLNAEMIGNEK